MQRLPIDDCLPELIDALRAQGRAVLQAPPGAGKTTRVPLAMLEAGLTGGRIVMLEPRRLATRAAAERLAEGLGEAPGGRVGYRMRGANVPGARVEVVTEGILTRMLQSDPELPGIGAVIFDEFHERSLNADLGLALVLEARAALRPDLLVLAMSATLDAAPVAALMDDAPVITAQGRSFPGRNPVSRYARAQGHAAGGSHRAADRTGRGRDDGRRAGLPARRGRDPPHHGATVPARGLPGPATLWRPALCRAARGDHAHGDGAQGSAGHLDCRDLADHRGYPRGRGRGPGAAGALRSRLGHVAAGDGAGQPRRGHAARGPRGPGGRGCVLQAVDTGRRRRPARLRPARGRGGRPDRAGAGTRPLGQCRPALPDTPAAARLDEARALLRDLGALDGADRITPHGRALARLPLHPRLGHMLQVAGRDAAPLAALLAERDILRGAPADLALRLAALQGGHDGPGEVVPAARDRVRAEAKRLAKGAPRSADTCSPAQMAALAYPDRVGLRRAGDAPRYVLSGGKGAVLDAADPLAGQRLLVVTDTDGNPREARIRAALPLTEGELRAVHGSRIAWQDHCAWSRRAGRVITRRQERFGALVLDDRRWPDAPPEAVARAMLEGIREIGLQLSPGAERFRARVALLRAQDGDLPDMGDAALLDGLEDWLLPHLAGVRSAEDWTRFDKLPALEAMLDWPQRRRLDRDVPATFTTPLGRKVPIDYDAEAPGISLRLQEMFGQTRHPCVAGRPLRVTLLSPAGRPVQTTMDLPGFWAESYADVRKDMRGQYPKHPWPEDPTRADPTLRTKRRG